MLKSNDEIFNELELLKQYSHLTPKKAAIIIEYIIKKPLKTKFTYLRGFGKLPGKSRNDVIKKCIEILSKVRYLETRKVFKILEKIYINSSEDVRREVVKAIEDLCGYDLFALQHIEYKPQTYILKEIEGWSKKRIKNEVEVMLAVTRELLKPTFEGHSWPDYKSVTFHSGVLHVSGKLKDIRSRTISFLKKAYLSSSDLTQKIKIIQVLQEATQTPHSHLYGEDVEQMVLDDTNAIIDFYLVILPGADNEIIQDIEEQKIWFIRRFTKKQPEKIDELGEAIRSNAGYEMFKTFVGYDGRLDSNFDFNKDKETRTKKIQEFVSEISAENFEEWRKKILTVVKNYAIAEPGSYSYLGMFLMELGQKKSDLAIRLIKENEEQLKPFMLNLLSGIWKSDDQAKAKQIILQWVNEGKYLSICALIFVFIEDIDDELMKSIINKAKLLKDNLALNNILQSIIQNYSKSENAKLFFLETVRALTETNDTRWVDHLWFRKDSILLTLTEKEFDVILDSLLLVENIVYQAEEILKIVAEKYPDKIINFFLKRVEIKSKRRKSGVFDRYDGVPFNFHILGGILRPHEKIIIPMILKWYEYGNKRNHYLFAWEASHLFEEIFPALSPLLEKTLINLIAKGDKEGRSTVLSILSKHKGEEFLWNIVRALVMQYSGTKEYKEIKGPLFGYLSQTGVVVGEDGFVTAYKAKKQAVKELKEDSDKRVRNFAKEYEDYLDKLISYQQRRTNEEIELMKRGLR